MLSTLTDRIHARRDVLQDLAGGRAHDRGTGSCAFDNRPAWDNKTGGGGFDNRDGWDNWDKS